VTGQSDTWARFAAITYDNSESKFVYSARRYHNKPSSYICQLQQQGLSMIQPHYTEGSLGFMNNYPVHNN